MSDINFRLGSSKEPKGHAVIYFVEEENIFVSYVVDFPITVDMSKYIPEMFADQIPDQDMDKIIIPPVPEKYEGSMESLENLCNLRGDDLVDGGTINIKDSTLAMSKLSKLGKDYSDICKDFYDNVSLKKIFNNSADSSKNDFSNLTESELLAEITKIVGNIKFLKDNNESINSEIENIDNISSLLPENRKIKEILRYLDLEKKNSEAIISAYISRAYSMFKEDYIKVKELENEILELENNWPLKKEQVF